MNFNKRLIKDMSIFVENFSQALEKEFEELAKDMTDEAKDKVPVDTGALQKSLEFKVNKEGNEVEIYFDAENAEEYWHYVEFGTSKQMPQPYVRLAVEYGVEKLGDILKQAFKKAGK